MPRFVSGAERHATMDSERGTALPVPANDLPTGRGIVARPEALTGGNRSQGAHRHARQFDAANLPAIPGATPVP